MKIQKYRLLFALLMLSGLLNAEEWYVSYDDALKNIKDQNWSEAIKNLQDALSEKPEPALKAKTTGMRFINYIPYYKLGLVYYQQGKCSEALAALNKSLEYGLIKSIREEYPILQNMIADCQKRLAPVVQDQIVQNKPVESKNETIINESISDGDKQFNDQKYDEALASYNKAKSLIEKSGGDKSALPSVKDKIIRTNQRIRTKESFERADSLENEGKYAEAIAEVRKIFVYDPDNVEAKHILNMLTNLQKTSAESEKVRLPISKPAEKIENKEGYLKQMEDAKKLLNLEDYKNARAKVSAALQIREKDFEALQLLQRIEYSEKVDDINYAIDSYFNGRIEECKKKLEPAVEFLSSIPEYKEKLKFAYVFQAASLIDQHYLEGRTTNELLNEAKEKIKLVYGISPAFELEKKYFSAKVISFFKKESSR
jgi:tetratricopeptide (TPR) repeat protein